MLILTEPINNNKLMSDSSTIRGCAASQHNIEELTMKNENGVAKSKRNQSINRCLGPFGNDGATSKLANMMW
jgi:hypothetical protein